MAENVATTSEYKESPIPAEQDEESPSQLPLSISNLQNRCNHLLDELSYFTSYLASLKRGDTIEIRSFRSGIQSELRSLNRLAASTSAHQNTDIKHSKPTTDEASGERNNDVNSDRITHTLRSSNVPFYETVWSTAKRSKGVIAFSRRFYWSAPTRAEKRAARAPDTSTSTADSSLSKESSTGNQETDDNNQKRPTKSSGQAVRSPMKLSALVDIVANDGAEWIKISTVTETRLLFELAKQGWERDGLANSSDDEYSGDEGNNPQSRDNTVTTDSNPRGYEGCDDDNLGNADSEDEDEVSILKAARDLSRASQAHRVRYQRPRVRIVLPKVTSGSIGAIDALLANVRATGAAVETSNDMLSPPLSSNSLPSALPDVPVADAISQGDLASDPLAHLTKVINIDCTILLALVSDLSHTRVDAEPWFHSAVRRQIEVEEKETLLPSVLYPVLRGRQLVCTDVAVKRMREIVETIGTESEKARTEVLVNERRGDTEDIAASSRHQWAKLSDYDVPHDLRLPILTVQLSVDAELLIDEDAITGTPQQRLPSIAREVVADLSELNTSVFLYSWRTGRTCITSNRAVVKQIEAAIEELSAGREEKGEEVRGPEVWLCGAARSLVGKEKGRREG